jgi:hypothetical protein
MHERKVLNDNEWFGWVQWMRNCFKLGTIKEHWTRIQESQWYDSAFEDFIDKQVIAFVEREIRKNFFISYLWLMNLNHSIQLKLANPNEW